MSDTELMKFNVVWKLEKYFQFELYTLESQDCSI